MSDDNDIKNLKNNIDALKNDLGKMVGDIGSVVDNVVELGKTEAKQAKEKIEAEVRKATDGLPVDVDQAKQASADVVDDLKKKMAANPLASLVAVFGIGFLVGSLLRKD